MLCPDGMNACIDQIVARFLPIFSVDHTFFNQRLMFEGWLSDWPCV